MSWETDDGKHEGWDSTELTGGRRSAGSTSTGVIVRSGKHGEFEQVVPDREVIGWRGRCECGWAGTFWARVTDPAQTDPLQRRIYVAVDDYADTPSDVVDAIHAEWKRHVEPDERVAGVREAAEQAARAREELDVAVQAARDAGASWADIGSAVGITRQSARERWN